MKAQPVGALELVGNPLEEIALGVEPGDLVFVLVGHHLEQRAGGRLGQRRVAAKRAPPPRAPAGSGRRSARHRRRSGSGSEIRRGARSSRRASPTAGGSPAPHPWGSARASTDAAVERGAAAPLEGAAVERDRDAVQFDGALDRIGRHRHQPLLIGVAEHEQIGGDRIAEEPGRQARRLDELGIAVTDRGGDRCGAGRARETAGRGCG